MNKVTSIALGLLIAAAGFVGVGLIQGDIAKAESRECGDNAIVRCGTMSASELKSKYAQNDRSLKKISSLVVFQFSNQESKHALFCSSI